MLGLRLRVIAVALLALGVLAALTVQPRDAEEHEAAQPSGALPGVEMAAARPEKKAAAPPAQGAAAKPGGGARKCAGKVALTFDDGPNPRATRQLIRVLVRNKVPATFFVVGRRAQAHPEVIREIERAGFLLGNHTWSHRQMPTQSSHALKSTLASTDGVLRAAGVHPTRLMRPPYGATTARVRRIIRKSGYVSVLWTIDSEDWASGSSRTIARRIVGSLRPGGNIVLQHDGVDRSPISVGAVDRVIKVARSRGYCFTALDEKGRPGFPTPKVSVTPRSDGSPSVVVRLDRQAGRALPVMVDTSTLSAAGVALPAVRKRVVVPAGRMSVVVALTGQ